ncbi:V-type ATP synthase subunit E family protein [Oscillibacter sp.]|uniref:V-type ATP synthase subunit E n=1 Tax=Oscillibacter sp. TaxID=1945593 RepID=UPI0028AEB5B6|nr:V-type ATP synthase subunit E family protein [Oscillibacter sp.]
MNGIEKITDCIAAEAQLEIDRVLVEAKAETEKITEKYRAQADREAAEAAAKNEKTAAEREERLVSVAQMEARKDLLAAKQSQVEAAFDLALKTLRDMPEDRYIAVAADLLVRAAGEGGGEVVFSPADREKIGQAAVDEANRRLNGKLTLSDETRPLKGGFILVDGSVEANCTFDTLVRLQKGEMAGEVAAVLFPEG